MLLSFSLQLFKLNYIRTDKFAETLTLRTLECLGLSLHSVPQNVTIVYFTHLTAHFVYTQLFSIGLKLGVAVYSHQS